MNIKYVYSSTLRFHWGRPRKRAKTKKKRLSFFCISQIIFEPSNNTSPKPKTKKKVQTKTKHSKNESRSYGIVFRVFAVLLPPSRRFFFICTRWKLHTKVRDHVKQRKYKVHIRSGGRESGQHGRRLGCPISAWTTPVLPPAHGCQSAAASQNVS